jgi:hypothetical protein
MLGLASALGANWRQSSIAYPPFLSASEAKAFTQAEDDPFGSVSDDGNLDRLTGLSE